MSPQSLLQLPMKETPRLQDPEDHLLDLFSYSERGEEHACCWQLETI